MEQAAPRGPSGDPYRVLGVGAGAAPRDIARAYRQAAQRAHPDTRPGDPAAAAARFQALTAAYDLLRDPRRRAAYDRAHPAAGPAGPPPPPPAPRGRGPLLWAGPVHVQPPPTAPAASKDERSTTAQTDDPVVLLGPHPGQAWGGPW